MRADAVYYLRDKVRFTNPFLDDVPSDYFYSFVLVCWEPTRATASPVMHPLELPRAEHSLLAKRGHTGRLQFPAELVPFQDTPGHGMISQMPLIRRNSVKCF